LKQDELRPQDCVPREPAQRHALRSQSLIETAPESTRDQRPSDGLCSDADHGTSKQETVGRRVEHDDIVGAPEAVHPCCDANGVQAVDQPALPRSLVSSHASGVDDLQVDVSARTQSLAELLE
jgi:hypothetical protein